MMVSQVLATCWTVQGPLFSYLSWARYYALMHCDPIFMKIRLRELTSLILY